MISKIVCGPKETVLSVFNDTVPVITGTPCRIGLGRPGQPSMESRFARDILDNPGRISPLARLEQGLRFSNRPPSLRVLFAEDSPEQQLLIKYYMGAFPCMVEFASDGIEVVETFRRNPFPFVFMDMRMPRMDGLQATRAIRRWEAEQNRSPACIVALTGLCAESDHDAIRQAGCDSVLAKPYSKREFLLKMKEVLQIP